MILRAQARSKTAQLSIFFEPGWVPEEPPMEWNFCNWDFVEDFPVDFVYVLVSR